MSGMHPRSSSAAPPCPAQQPFGSTLRWATAHTFMLGPVRGSTLAVLPSGLRT